MLRISKKTSGIANEMMFSTLNWEERYDILMEESTVVITDSLDLVNYIEENYNCQGIFHTKFRGAKQWKKLVETREQTHIVLCFSTLNNRVISLFGVLRYLRLPFYWAGVDLLTEEFEDLFAENKRYEMLQDVTLKRQGECKLIEDPEDLPSEHGLISLSSTYFRKNWYFFTPIVLRGMYSVIIKDAFVKRRESLSIHELIDITTKIFSHFNRLTERELVYILQGLPILNWKDLPPEYRTLLLYGVVDIDTYEALQNYYIKVQLQEFREFYSISGHRSMTLLLRMEGKEEEHTIQFAQTHLECRCNTFTIGLPCTGIIVVLTRRRTLQRFGKIGMEQIIHWLKGLGIINALLHTRILTFSSGKTKIDRRFEGDTRVVRLQLTRFGREVVRWNINFLKFLELNRALQFIAKDVVNINVRTIFEIAEEVLDEEGFTEHEVMISSMTGGTSDEIVLRQLHLLDLLSSLTFSHGLLEVSKKIRALFFRIRERQK